MPETYHTAPNGTRFRVEPCGQLDRDGCTDWRVYVYATVVPEQDGDQLCDEAYVEYTDIAGAIHHAGRLLSVIPGWSVGQLTHAEIKDDWVQRCVTALLILDGMIAQNEEDLREGASTISAGKSFARTNTTL